MGREQCFSVPSVLCFVFGDSLLLVCVSILVLPSLLLLVLFLFFSLLCSLSSLFSNRPSFLAWDSKCLADPEQRLAASVLVRWPWVTFARSA